MTPIRKHEAAVVNLESHRSKKRTEDEHGFVAGGPVGAMHAELSARLNSAEYEAWLLPPEPESRLERTIRWLSMGAGVVALTGGAAVAWFILG